MKLISSLILLLLTIVPALQAGFGVDTPVKTPQGHVNIQVLQKSDQVVSWADNHIDAHLLTKTRRSGAIKVVQIKLPNSTLTCDLKQSFFLPVQNKWQEASDLQVGVALLNFQGELVQILDVQVLSKTARIFSLEVDQAHTYFVSHDEVLVHNGIPILVGLAWTFGGGSFEFVGANLMVGIIGWLYDRNSNSVKTRVNTSHLDEAVNGCYRSNGSNGSDSDDNGDQGSDGRKNKTPNQLDAEDAAKLGFKRDKNPPFNSHNRHAFRKGDRWITGDIDGHCGGRWKMFNGRSKRLGTFDKNLNKIGE